MAPWFWLGYLIYLETVQSGTGLGADPAEALLHYLGEWALIVLLCALSITPLQRQLGWAILIPCRRMVGLFAFAFVVCHALVYAVFYVQFDGTLLLQEVAQRPYITLGITSLLLLTPLAITSTRGWQRRLGQSWKALHRWVYPALALALAHLLWLTKDGYGEVALFAAWAAFLAGERLYAWRIRQRKTPTSPVA